MGARSETLRIGVLGAGPIAQAAHFEACQKAHNTHLQAICDRAPDLLQQMAWQYAPESTYSSYDEMLADPKIDAVLIAVADQFHVETATAAIRAGKHVFVEKPLGVNAAECEALAELVHETGLTLQIGTMRRFDEGIQFAREFIREELGEMLAVKAWYCDSAYRYTMTDAVQPLIRESSYALRPPGDPKADRQKYLMLGHGSHLVDTVRFLGGDIKSVTAKLVERAGAYCWFAQVDFVSGAIGHLDLTIGVRMDWHEGFQVYGEGGSVVAKTFLPWYLRTSEVECFSAKDRTYHRPLGADSQFFRRQIEGFAETALHGSVLTGAGVDDGLAALRVMEAIERSVLSGQTEKVEATYREALS